MKSMKFPFRNILVGIVVLAAVLMCVQGWSANPEKVYFVREVGVKGADWYHQQAALWKGETERNPRNAGAWLNYYLATEYSYWGRTDAKAEKQARLKQILKGMEKNIPDAFEYYLLQNRFDHENFAALEKAYQLQPSNPYTYYDFIMNYELKDNSDKFREFNQKLYNSHDVATGLVNYNYNMLMSVAPNAILFTNGDNDTYPGWMLQQVKNIRPDVLILNIHTLQVKPGYLTRKLSEKNVHLPSPPDKNSPAFAAELCRAVARNNPELPLYFAVTVYKERIKPLSENLFLEGLAYRYSPGRYDNVARVKKNLENNFRLDYLKYDWYSESHPSTATVVPALNQNYISGMTMLYEHYSEKKDVTRAEYWKNFALDIAQKGGHAEELKKYFEEKQEGDS
jgi:hypothetical protein